MTRTAEREQFLSDIIIAAIEGGTGYWASVVRYKWADENGEDLPPSEVHAVIAEGEELDDAFNRMQDEGIEPPFKISQVRAFDPTLLMTIDIDTIASGISKVLSEGFRINGTLREIIRVANKENDAGMIDADAADVIVQTGLFGSIIYG